MSPIKVVATQPFAFATEASLSPKAQRRLDRLRTDPETVHKDILDEMFWEAHGELFARLKNEIPGDFPRPAGRTGSPDDIIVADDGLIVLLGDDPPSGDGDPFAGGDGTGKCHAGQLIFRRAATVNGVLNVLKKSTRRKGATLGTLTVGHIKVIVRPTGFGHVDPSAQSRDKLALMGKFDLKPTGLSSSMIRESLGLSHVRNARARAEGPAQQRASPNG